MLKNLLLLSSFSAFVVVTLIGLEIYHNFTKSSLTSRTQTRIIPIPPNFDTETLEGLKLRNPIDVNLSDKASIFSQDTQDINTTPTPSITNNQIATGSAPIL